MAKITVNVSILFADIAGSSQLYEMLGNDQAQRLIVKLLSALSDLARRHNGEALRTIGDEVMCAFEHADDAVAASLAMHTLVATYRLRNNGASDINGLYIRIDTGACIRDGQELFGEPVNSAASIKSLAKPNQTLISENTRNELSTDYKSTTRFIGKLPIKGKSGTFKIFEHVWEDAEITAISLPQQRFELTPTVLDIANGKNIITVDSKHPTLSIGRLPDNDLILKYPHVSRMHAKIEYRSDRFMLADFSINGTYVLISGRSDVFIKHEEVPLDGKGLICPGRRADAGSPDAIHYVVRY